MPERTYASPIAAPAADLFTWHARAGAFERLVPPWAQVELAAFEGIRDGQRAELRIGPAPARLRWIAEHADYIEGLQFRDIQRRGPFRRWIHTHRMEPVGPAESRLVDAIVYDLPFGPLGALGGGAIRSQLDRQFAYRHRTTATDLAAHRAMNPDGRRLRVAISGASGTVGRLLSAFLTTGGHQVVRLVRAPGSDDAVYWNPATGEIDRDRLEGLDAVVHLAGEPIMAIRWTEARKRRIAESRIAGTHLLSEALARLRRPPAVFLSASGIAGYGARGDALVDETHEANGDGFLAGVCREWEAATAPAEAAGIRTAHLRIGVVLTPRGGALAQLVRPFRVGLGVQPGATGDYVSWIAPDDLLYAIHHLMLQSTLAGPVNLVAPAPATQEALARAIGATLGRPVRARIPPPVTRAALGEMARETLFQSLRLVPRRLLDDGFAFRYPALAPTLRHQLGHNPAPLAG